MQLDMDEHLSPISNIQKVCSYARQIEQMEIDGTLNYANFADVASNLVSISDIAMVQLTTMIPNEPTAPWPPLVSPIPMTQNISKDLSSEQCRSPSGRTYSRKGKRVRSEIQKPRDDNNAGPAEDGYLWKKYGRKSILGSPYPRNYYKCKEQSCPAKKWVQKTVREDYAVEYVDEHRNHPVQANSNRFELSRQISPPVSDSNILKFSVQVADQHSGLQELGSSTDFGPAFYPETPDLDLHHECLALNRNSAAEMHLDMHFHSFEAYGPTSPSIFDI